MQSIVQYGRAACYRTDVVTLRDIALDVGCSPSTVSRALNDDQRISDDRRAAIASSAKRLGYQINHVARALRRQRTGYVGVIVPNLTNSYYSFCVSHVTELLATRGYHVVLGCHNFNPMTDSELLQSFVERQVEGILHVPCTPTGAEGGLEAITIPIVEIGQRSSSASVDATYADDAKGIATVVHYLVERGHRKIAMIAGRRELLGVVAQTRGFFQAVADTGLSLDDCGVVHAPVNQHSSEDHITAIMTASQRPTALITAHSQGANAALITMRRLQLSVPGDISIIGFSNDDWFTVADPPLTTFQHPFHEMTLVGSQLLVERLQPDLDASVAKHVVEFGGKIIERSSVADLTSRQMSRSLS